MLLLRILVSKEWRGRSEQRAAFFLYYVSTKGYVISIFSLFLFLYKDSRYSDEVVVWTIRGSTPGRNKRFSSSPKGPNRSWDPLSHLFVGCWGFLP